VFSGICGRGGRASSSFAIATAANFLNWLERLTTPGDFKGHFRRAAFLFLLALLIVLFLMPLFNAPFERDQGTYATIARGWLQDALPYKDLWDNKGPLLFLWYAASFLLFGENTLSPRIAAALAAGASLPFLWAAARRLFDRRKAAIAAIIYALSFANLYLQVAANGEIFMLLPMTAGFWAFVDGISRAPGERRGLFSFFTAGFLTSLAIFTRQSAVMAFIAFFAWFAIIRFRRGGEESRNIISSVCSLLTGGVFGTLPFVIYFAIHGALYDLWYAMFGFNFAWASEQSFWLKFVPPLFIEPGPLAGGLIFWILAVVGCLELWKRKDNPSLLVLVFLIASEIAAQVMGKGSAHYSVQLLPGAAIAAAFGCHRLYDWWKNGRPCTKFLLGAAVTINAAVLLFIFAMPTAESRFRVQYTFRDYADDAIDAPAIAKEAAALSDPGGCVYEWGRSSQIFFLANRRPCSRWFYDRPYQSNKSMIFEVMADLQKRKPDLIILTSENPPPPELAELISGSYDYAGQVRYARFYRRAD